MYDPTEDAYEKIRQMLESDTKQKKVNLLLTPIQKNQLYHYISNIMKSGEEHDTIVKSIIVYVDDFLKEKHEEQNSTSAVPKGGAFRRVDD